MLWAAILIKVSEGAFKQSIHKAGLELLVLPIPSDIKPQAKTFIDVFVDSIATGTGGLLLIICTAVLGFSTANISLVILGLVAMWIFLIIRIRREYVQAFRTAIEKRSINLDDIQINVQDASLFDSITTILSSGRERQILYGMELIENVQNNSFVPILTDLLGHESATVRSRALKHLAGYRLDKLNVRVERMVLDSAPQVQSAAIGFLIDNAPSETEKTEMIQQFLRHTDDRIRAAALRCAANSATLAESLDLAAAIDYELGDGGASAKTPPTIITTSIATAIGQGRIQAQYDRLETFLMDTHAEVVEAAATSAGLSKDPRFVGSLVNLLANPAVRKFASQSLSAYGNQILPALETRFSDRQTPWQIRLHIPRVVRFVGSQDAVNMLTLLLSEDNPLVRYQIIKGLTNLRKYYPDLQFDRPTIEPHIDNEVSVYINTTILLYRQSQTTAAAAPGGRQPFEPDLLSAQRLLRLALTEKRTLLQEHIFRLLGLIFPQKDMYFAYLGLLSNKQDLRANAVEFLDNVLDPRLKRQIIPLIEHSSTDALVTYAQENLKTTVPNDEGCLDMLLTHRDQWLRCCALFLIAHRKLLGYRTRVDELTRSNHPLVRETASYAQQHLKA